MGKYVATQPFTSEMEQDSATIAGRLQQQSATISNLLEAGGAPGLSLGVFHQGRIIHTQHFGKRDVETEDVPDDDSVYGIASTFKIVAVCAVARLVTDGILGWDVPIRQYLSELDQRNDQLSEECTIRDLICHRTGLALANLYWGQQNGEALSSKKDFLRIVNHLPMVKPFRSAFIYAQWNFNLLQIIVERATKKSFNDYVREVIFDPLNLKTPTYDDPVGANVMRTHANRNDGTTVRIINAAFDSASGLAAGGGGKSGIRDQLNLCITLLAAYQHQVKNNVDTTPGSPFTQLRTIFSPQIAFPGARIEDQAYCLGLYRTKVPGNLSCASINGALPKNNLFIFGKENESRKLVNEEVFHHSSTTPGFMGAMFLVPRTQSGVIVHTNASARLDTADYAAQILLAALFDTDIPKVYPGLANAVVKMQFGWFAKLNQFLEACKTDVPPTHPLSAYAGTYWNTIHSTKLVITVRGVGLHVSLQGMPKSTFDLQPCDGDTFYWPADREYELVDRAMWFNLFPGFHMFNFTTNEKKVLSVSWQHEQKMDAEEFTKEEDDVTARL
jgi:CubicO group peptidase (beta-lactamase class C family)